MSNYYSSYSNNYNSYDSNSGSYNIDIDSSGFGNYMGACFTNNDCSGGEVCCVGDYSNGGT